MYLDVVSKYIKDKSFLFVTAKLLSFLFTLVVTRILSLSIFKQF